MSTDNEDSPEADPLVWQSATELAQRIRRRELSATEVVLAHIDRVATVNPQLNALVIPLFSEALEQAEEADRRLGRGDDVGPLHGVPVTIKEQFRVAGTQATLGVKSHVGNVSRDEGPLVSQLRAAGAVILGKTNIMQTLAGWECDNPVYGRTVNPYDLGRSSGGSSGGEAALIAAGGSPLGLAGDFGGSIRVPAHFCGVHGFKPTSQRLSNDDFAPGLLRGGQEIFIPQPGPLARTVPDLRLAMRLFAATSLNQTGDVVPPVPWPDGAGGDVAGLRVAVFTDNDHFPVSPAIRRVVDEAARALGTLGATVEPVAAPDPRLALELFLGANSADGGASLRALLAGDEPIAQIATIIRGARLPKPVRPVVVEILRRRGQPYAAEMVAHIGARSARKYQLLTEKRSAFRRAFRTTLDRGRFDAMICPPVAVPAFTHGSSEHLLPALGYSFVFNVLGVPAGVVSIGTVRPDEAKPTRVGSDMATETANNIDRGSAGLPVGVQVVARHWHDNVVLDVMAALEREFRSEPTFPGRNGLVV